MTLEQSALPKCLIRSGLSALGAPDLDAGVYGPGWIGTVLVGGFAALVFWGLYGPMAHSVLIGTPEAAGTTISLRVSELLGALVSGIGGGRLLSAEVEKKVLAREKEALDRTKNELVSTMKDLTKG